MSAIAGIFYFNGQPVESATVMGMTERLAHRGPDGSGIWIKGSIGLGHRLLHTTPESLNEKQPVENPSGEIVLVADARIDNREELLGLLDFSGYISHPISDSQIILAAYEKWGEDCPEKLLGDFAFAIWDSRKQKVFCARDVIGVRPFYYYISGDFFAFASEIKALLTLYEVPRKINEARIADHLLNSFDDKTSTFYEGILRLPPAHNFTVSHGSSRLRHYWDFDSSREIRLSSNEEYAEAFSEVFTSAVRCRLRSVFPVGASLSGGLDSSSISCTARNLLQEEGKPRLHTFSAIFPNLPKEDMARVDERKYIQMVLAQGGFDSHAVEADRLGPLSYLDDMLWHEDEAFLAPNLYIHWALYKTARQAGVKVFLDGLDGDTTVSHGLEYLGRLASTGRWLRLRKEASALSRKSPNRHFTPRKIAWQYGLKNLFPHQAARAWQTLRRRPGADSSEYDLFNLEFSQRVRQKEKRGDQWKWPLSSRESHYRSLNSGQIPYTLELADKACSAFGMEGRYPFFDRRLMELCLALPPEQKLNEGWTRVVMRRAMTGVLPQEVQWRIGKANLSPNFKRKLLDFSKPVIDDLFDSESEALGSYFNLSALRAAYNQYKLQPMSSEKEALIIYSAVMLGYWLRQSREDHFSRHNWTFARQRNVGSMTA